MGNIKVIVARKSISGSHLCIGKNFPDNIKVLEEERPTSLSTRKFARVLTIGKLFVISDDSNRMRSSLNVLIPFEKGKYNSEKFWIIEVVVSLSEGKGVREISTGMKITIGIGLEENSAGS